MWPNNKLFYATTVIHKICELGIPNVNAWFLCMVHDQLVAVENSCNRVNQVYWLLSIDCDVGSYILLNLAGMTTSVTQKSYL